MNKPSKRNDDVSNSIFALDIESFSTPNWNEENMV